MSVERMIQSMPSQGYTLCLAGFIWIVVRVSTSVHAAFMFRQLDFESYRLSYSLDDSISSLPRLLIALRIPVSPKMQRPVKSGTLSLEGYFIDYRSDGERFM